MQRWVVQLERGRANKVTGRPCLQSVGARLDLGTETSPRQYRFDEANSSACGGNVRAYDRSWRQFATVGSSRLALAFCLCMRDHWRVAVDSAVASGVDRQLAAVYLPLAARSCDQRICS